MNNQYQTPATIAEEKIPKIIYCKVDLRNIINKDPELTDEILYPVNMLPNLTSFQSNGSEEAWISNVERANELFSSEMDSRLVNKMIQEHSAYDAINITEIKVLGDFAQVKGIIDAGLDVDPIIWYYLSSKNNAWQFILPSCINRFEPIVLMRLYSSRINQNVVNEAIDCYIS